MALTQEQVIVKLSADVSQLQKQLRKAQRTTESTYESMSRTVKRVAGLIGGVAIAKQLIATGDAWTNLNSKLKLVTNSSKGLAVVQQELFTVSQNSRSGLEGTVDLYSKLARSTIGLGYSQGELVKVTETISKAMTVSGASAVEASASLQQLGQGLASGTLRGEELNSIMEQTPRLAEAIATGMGIAVGQLREYGSQGLISSEAVINALKSQGEAVNDEFKKMPITVGQSFTKFKNSALKAIGEIDKSFGATSGLAKTIEEASNYISNNMATIIETIKDLAGYAYDLGKAFVFYKATLIAGNAIEKISIALKTAMVAVSRAHDVAMNAEARALSRRIALQKTMNVLMKATPYALAIAGLTSLVGWFTKADSSVADASASVDQFTNSIKALTQAQLASEQYRLQDIIAEQTQALKEAQSEADALAQRRRYQQSEHGKRRGVGFFETEVTERAVSEAQAAADKIATSLDKIIAKNEKINELTQARKLPNQELITLGQLQNETVSGVLEKFTILNNVLESANGAVKNGTTFWGSWGQAADTAFKDATDQAKVAKQAFDAVTSTVSSGLTSAFRQAMDGAVDWGETFKTILKDVAAELIRVLVIQKAVAALAGGGGGSTPNVSANAKGGVYDGGAKVHAYAKGGIVDQPTNFPMSGNNVGLMGEAGAEAIMPLDRMGDGSLGVKAAPVSINVINNAGADVSVEKDGDDWNVLIQKVDKALADGVSRRTNSLSSAISGLK